MFAAKRNLESRPKVEELKEELKLKYQELESLKSKVDGKLVLQTEKTETRSLPHLQVSSLGSTVKKMWNYENWCPLKIVNEMLHP